MVHINRSISHSEYLPLFINSSFLMAPMRTSISDSDPQLQTCRKRKRSHSFDLVFIETGSMVQSLPPDLMTSRIKEEPGRCLRVDEVSSSSVAAAGKKISCLTEITTDHQPHRVDQSKLIEFSPRESLKLSYPVNCPVWYNFSSRGNDTSFCRGRVVGVAMDCNSRKFVYRIQNSDLSRASKDETELVYEDDVSYEMGCPVRVIIEGNEHDGEIVCSTREPIGIGIQVHTKYSILISSANGRLKLVQAVASSQVKYRSTGEKMKMERRVSYESETREIKSIVSNSTKDSLDSTGRVMLHQLKWKPPSPNKRKTLADRDSNSSLNSKKMLKKKRKKL